MAGDGSHLGIEGATAAAASQPADRAGIDTSPGRAVLRRLRLRTLIVLVVLLPTVSTIVVVTGSAVSRWDYRSNAETVRADVRALNDATSARITLESWTFPAEGITYAWDEIHLDTAQIARVIGVNFASMLPSATRGIAANRFLGATKVERTYQARIVSLEPAIIDHTVSFSELDEFRQSYENLVDGGWTSVYERLLSATRSWQPPGSFYAHEVVLLQTYRAYLDMLDTILYANIVLSGSPSLQNEIDYFTAVEGFQTQTGSFFDIPGFPGDLGPRGRAAWEAIVGNPHLADTQKTFAVLAVGGVAGGSTAFAGSSGLALYETAFRYISPYMNALGNLIHAEGDDLSTVANSAAATAADEFTGEVAFLAVIVMAALGGALLLSRAVTRPVRRLAEVAGEVQQGDFHADPLPAAGPREIAVASRTFNEMVTMLGALEEKTVALAKEDLADPVLREPLPGRAGRALQRAVEQLTARARAREQERQQLKVEASHDELTGLLNRRAVLDVLGRDVRRRRGEGDVVATIYVDLDGLKDINDTFGHEVGDAAIQATSEALRASTRQGDVVARLGGDEFLVIIHVRSPAEADTVADQISEAVAARTVSAGGEEIALSCSTGVSVTELGSDADPFDLVRVADANMYATKRRKRAPRPGWSVRPAGADGSTEGRSSSAGREGEESAPTVARSLSPALERSWTPLDEAGDALP